MDIYQCLSCGQQWPHGGMLSSFVATAQHADETRFLPGGMHTVVIGERYQVEAQYARHRAGEPVVQPNDMEQMRAAPAPVPPPATVSALAQRLGVSDDAARLLVEALFMLPPTRELPESALSDVLPAGGRLDQF